MIDSIAEILCETLFKRTGKFVVPLITAGRWRVDAEKAKQPRAYTGPRYMGETKAMFIGAATCFVLIFVLALLVAVFTASAQGQ
jgi:hypothetical protein